LRGFILDRRNKVDSKIFLASTYGVNSMSIDVTKMERKEPIGAEQDDDTNSVLSLEQILQSPNKSFSTKEIIKIRYFEIRAQNFTRR